MTQHRSRHYTRTIDPQPSDCPSAQHRTHTVQNLYADLCHHDGMNPAKSYAIAPSRIPGATGKTRVDNSPAPQLTLARLDEILGGFDYTYSIVDAAPNLSPEHRRAIDAGAPARYVDLVHAEL